MKKVAREFSHEVCRRLKQEKDREENRTSYKKSLFVFSKRRFLHRIMCTLDFLGNWKRYAIENTTRFPTLQMY